MSKNREKIGILSRIALLIALEVVLNRFGSINTMGLKIGLSFIPMALCAVLYGPVWAMAAYAISDFIGAMLFPIGPYHPGFTVCAAAMGLMYWVFLKARPIRLGSRTPHHGAERLTASVWANIMCVTLINCLILGLFVNTYWVSQLYSSKNYWGWFIYRLSQYAVLVPVHIIFLPIIYKLESVLKKAGLIGKITGKQVS